MSIGNLGSCRCTKQTRRHLHFCIVTCFARGAAPCVCALVHQCGRDSIGFDSLQPGLAVIRINPDRRKSSVSTKKNGEAIAQSQPPGLLHLHQATVPPGRYRPLAGGCMPLAASPTHSPPLGGRCSLVYLKKIHMYSSVLLL